MKVEVSIDPSCKEPKIIILTDKMTEEISDMMKRLSLSNMDALTVFSDKVWNSFHVKISSESMGRKRRYFSKQLPETIPFA